MDDPRISCLLDAARRMHSGDFDIELPLGGDDDVGELADALQELSKALEQHFRELRAITQVTERVNAGLMLDQVCTQVYDSFRELIPYDRIGLALLEDEGRILRSRWARSESSQVHLPVGFGAKMAGSSLVTIIETSQPRIINDLVAYLEQHPDSDSTRRVVADGVRSSLTCPLVAEGKPIGFLFFSSFMAHTYQDAHVGLFQSIASQLSVIVEKGRLYQDLIELDGFKSRVLGVAAHDLRNPLTQVVTSLELLDIGAGGDLSAQGRGLLAQAMRASQRMVKLIEDLLDISAIESGRLVLNLEPVELGPWLSGVARDQQLLATTKDIRIQTDLPTDPLVVRMDLHRIEQVAVNLLSNALKFSHPGTTITVAARAITSGVEIAVSDQGPGVAPHELGRLFEAYSTTSNRPTGGEASTGLGLAICKRIVDVHGGELRVVSQLDVGTTFTVWLPG